MAPLSALRQKVASIVFSAVREIAKERAGHLDFNTSLVADLGLDSLERLQIACSLEESFGARIPDPVLQEIETIGEITDAILTHVGSTLVKRRTSPACESTKQVRLGFENTESQYMIEQLPEFNRVQNLKSLIASSRIRNPYFSTHEGPIADTTQIAGRKLISYSSYNYLGYATDASVRLAAKDAIDQFGTSVSSSPVSNGMTIHRDLEKETAAFLGVEDVIMFPGGYGMNETVIGHVIGSGDLIVHDALAHNSIIQGAELSGAQRRSFEHNDWKQLDQLLDEIRHDYRCVLIAVEGLYSMDGDYPDLPKFVEVKKKHRAWLFVDEAHSIGTLGETGRGIAELQAVDRKDIEFSMGTYSKSLASCGGFIGGDSGLIDYLRNTTPGYVFAAGMSPANVGAALQSLRNLASGNDRVQALQSNSIHFSELAGKAGLNTGLSRQTPIIPLITGDALKALQISEKLFQRDIHAQPILYPAVADNEARIRFFITALHTSEQIEKTVEILAEVVNES